MSALPPEKLAPAMASVMAWRQNPSDKVVCPVCAAPTLTIVDRSARPYTEWYAITCNACGLDETISVPMAPPSYGD